ARQSLLFYYILRVPLPTLFPYTTLFRSIDTVPVVLAGAGHPALIEVRGEVFFPVAAFEELNVSLVAAGRAPFASGPAPSTRCTRSEEHTSELQSRFDLVCRLLLEKKKER